MRQTHIAESLIAPTNQSEQYENIKVDQSVAESFRFYEPSHCGSTYKHPEMATPQLPGASDRQTPTGRSQKQIRTLAQENKAMKDQIEHIKKQLLELEGKEQRWKQRDQDGGTGLQGTEIEGSHRSNLESNNDSQKK